MTTRFKDALAGPAQRAVTITMASSAPTLTNTLFSLISSLFHWI
jgi:hypothetical protein